MKKNYKYNWLLEDINNTKKKIWLGSIIHFIMMVVLFMDSGMEIMESSRFFFILGSWILITGTALVYNFANPFINSFLLLTYFSLLIMEIIALGLPGLGYLMSVPFLELGSLLDILLMTFPLVYLFLRIMSVWPLFDVIRMQKSIEKYNFQK